jgi:hypothetical protein
VKPILHGIYQETFDGEVIGEYIVLDIDELNGWVTVYWTMDVGAEQFPVHAMQYDKYVGQASELMLALI